MVWVVLVAIVVTYYFVQWIVRSLKVDNFGDKFVFVTGCDMGFGRELAQRLDNLGFNVFAGCLTEDGAKSLSSVSSKRLHALPLDVSKTESIEAAVKTIKQELPPEKGLWALVNNSGIGGAWSPSEMCTRQEFQSVFEVNIFGLAETTRLCLPLVRKARGRVVNMASAAGRIAFVAPPYTCSKFAVEAYSDILRREMFKANVKVSVLEPGVFRTNIVNVEKMVDAVKQTRDKAPQEVKDFYGPGLLDRCRERFIGFFNGGSADISLVVNAYIHALTARYPMRRYPLGRDCKLIFQPLTYLPDWVVDWFIALNIYPNGV